MLQSYIYVVLYNLSQITQNLEKFTDVPGLPEATDEER